MTPAVGILVAALAVVGACTRHLLAQVLNNDFPVGTLVANLCASFLLGLASGLEEPWSVVIAIGGLGALSTWSAAANEVAEMARREQGALAIAYLTLTATAGVLAAWLGITIAAAAGWR